jgi:hypothetical protein
VSGRSRNPDFGHGAETIRSQACHLKYELICSS